MVDHHQAPQWSIRLLILDTFSNFNNASEDFNDKNKTPCRLGLDVSYV